MRNAVSLKPKPGGSGSAYKPGHQVDLLQIVSVHASNLFAPRRVVGQLFERLHRILVQEPAELVVAGHAAFPISEDVYGGQVEMFSVIATEILQMLRVVVQRDGAGVAASERIEQVGHAYPVHDTGRLFAGQLGQLDLFNEGIGFERPNHHLIGDERMHPVHGDELFGERVRSGVVIVFGSDDAAENFVVVQERQDFLQFIAGQAVPVRVHRDLGHRVRQDGRRPLDGVDLGHERRVDELGFAVQLRIGPSRMFPDQEVADVVVLARKHRVKHREPNPPVFGESAQVHAGVGVDGQELRRLDLQLAAFPGSQLGGDFWIGPINLRSIPPVSVWVCVCRRPLRPWRRGLGHRSRNLHASCRTSRLHGPAVSRRTTSRCVCARTSRAP